MKVAVLGATGMVGSAVVSEAFSRGHQVTAASRTPDHTVVRGEVSVRAVDVAQLSQVEELLGKVDVAVLTIRLPPGEESRLASLTHGVLDVSAQTHTRVLVVGGSAPLHVPGGATHLVIDDRHYVPEQWQPIARASLAQLEVCRAHRSADWVYLSPPAILEPAQGLGRYRRGSTTLLVDANGASRIAASDLAIAVLDELEQPSDEQHFTVAAEAVPKL